MIAGQSTKIILKHEISTLLSSPIIVFIITMAIFGLGLSLCIYLTSTLLLPLIFSALMFPAVLSAFTHFSLPRRSKGFRA